MKLKRLNDIEPIRLEIEKHGTARYGERTRWIESASEIKEKKIERGIE